MLTKEKVNQVKSPLYDTTILRIVQKYKKILILLEKMFQGQISGLGVVLSGNAEDSLAYIKHLE